MAPPPTPMVLVEMPSGTRVTMPLRPNNGAIMKVPWTIMAVGKEIPMNGTIMAVDKETRMHGMVTAGGKETLMNGMATAAGKEILMNGMAAGRITVGRGTKMAATVPCSNGQSITTVGTILEMGDGQITETKGADIDN